MSCRLLRHLAAFFLSPLDAHLSCPRNRHSVQFSFLLTSAARSALQPAIVAAAFWRVMRAKRRLAFPWTPLPDARCLTRPANFPREIGGRIETSFAVDCPLGFWNSHFVTAFFRTLRRCCSISATRNVHRCLSVPISLDFPRRSAGN